MANAVHYTGAMAAPLTEAQLIEARDRIRAVTERHIVTHGPEGISLRAIAADLGWTAASLYRYYASKAELIDAVRTAAYRRFSERIEAGYASSADLWQSSRAIGDAYIAFAMAEPAAYQLIFAYVQDDAEKSAELRQEEARSKRTMTAYVGEMVEAGLLEGDPQLIAHAYWASLHGLIVLSMAGKLNTSPPFDQLRHAMMRMITRGARPAVAAPARPGD